MLPNEIIVKQNLTQDKTDDEINFLEGLKPK